MGVAMSYPARHISPLSVGSFGGGGATFRFVTLRQMFSEVFNVPRRYSYCFNNDNTITTFSLPRYDFTFFKEFHSN